jgi:exopolysaccharide biosynthesis polyprenyl glycosylphosphotransferase
MNKRWQTLKYLIFDALSAGLAYGLMFTYRKQIIEPQRFGSDISFSYDQAFFTNLSIIVCFWLILYTITGTYRSIYRRSRLKEFLQTFTISLFGCVVLFFMIILDDFIANYKSYYQSLGILFGAHFFLTATGRIILSTNTAHRIHRRKIGFNSLMIGSNENALAMFNELEGLKKSVGFIFKGFVHINGGKNHSLEGKLEHLGHFRDIESIIEEHKIEDVIIALESNEHDKINSILNELEGLPVNVKIIPKMYDILSGQVKMTSILGAPLIDINQEIMPVWQYYSKRVMDIVLAFFSLIILFPLYCVIAIGVKFSSKGPVFYSHERIGIYGKPFKIYKFRSMFQDAEQNGPALSSENDSRITPFGKFLRRSRMDELPQFWNVVIGDMSLVGPRPERQFFIDQIVKVAPHYKHLQKVRPGITSWGQVKYGYAENVGEMVERLKFDVLYIENMSMLVDLKILIHTVVIVFQGRGK